MRASASRSLLPLLPLLLVCLPILAALSLVGACSDDPVDRAGPAPGPGTPSDPGPPPVAEHLRALKADVEREAPRASDADLAQLVRDQLAFALQLHARGVEANGADRNFLFSPLSIATAFGMLWPGAVGETADEIAAMMQFGLAEERFHPAANALDQALASRNGYTPREDEGDAPILEIVNDVWIMDDYPYVQAYLELLARHYGAGLWIVDFVNAAAEAREEINAYIGHRTRGLIPELLPDGSVTDRTRLVLTNALYFRGAWRFPFATGRTAPAPFTDASGQSREVPMMVGEIEAGHYTERDGVQVVELDYVGDGLSMVLILPEAGTFAAFEEGLDADGLLGLLQALQPMAGQIAMPRFAFDAELDLVEVFRAAGYEVPFTEGLADFSGLSETAVAEGLHVTGAFHTARIVLDEEGTEAAAATAILVGAESAPVEFFDVRLDRPFLFLLRDRPTGAVLFLGRVVDAAAAQE